MNEWRTACSLPFFMEDRRIFKFWIALGMIVAIFFFCFGVRTFAFDFEELDFNYIYRKYNEQSRVYTSQYGYDINGAMADYWGIETGFPVPTRAEDGSYSIYFKLKFSVDNNPNSTFDLKVAPSNETYSVYPINMGPSIFADCFGELDQYNCNMKHYYGSFSWEYHSSCTYELLAMREFDTSYQNQRTYTLIGVMDLRLMEEDEMLPFRFGIQMFNYDVSSGSTMYNVDATIKFMDTSKEEIMLFCMNQIVDKLDSLSVDVSVDTSEIERLLNSILLKDGATQGDVERLWIIFSRYVSEMMDYNETQTDADITEWASQVEGFESKVDELHEIEESMIGSLASFEFPTAGTYTEVERSFFSFWFLDPLLTPMILTGLALMIAFLIL